MIVKILLASLALVPAALAADLTAAEIRERLEVRADVYRLDASGKRVVAGPLNNNYWRIDAEKGLIEGDWSSDSGTWGFNLRHRVEVMESGRIKFSLQEFGSQEKRKDTLTGPVFRDLLEKKELELEGFEPVTWIGKGPSSKGLMIRYFVGLREVTKPIAMDALPIGGSGISITDNHGYLWADGLKFLGKYTGVTTHRGMLVMSYSPFRGATEMGYAEGNEIRLKVNKDFKITLKSNSSFLPAGVTSKVYAIYRPDKKSKGVNSVHSFDTGQEARLEEKLK